MANAYEIAKAGGRHKGLVRRFAKEREASILKSIRSLQAMILEHQDKINNPMKYLEPNVSLFHRQDLVTRYWPEEIENFEQQIDVLTGILQERNNEQSS